MDVIDLLNKEKISFTVSGQDFQIKCLNPDHDDHNPSLRIDKVNGVMHCFSCGFRGNIFTHFGAPPTQKTIRLHKVRDKIQKIRSDNVGLKIPEKSVRFVGAHRNISAETLLAYGAFTHFEKEFAGRLVFPLKDITGKIRAFIGRAMDNTIQPKYLIQPKGAQLPMFPSNPDMIHGEVVLVEGIFDALNLIDKGLHNAVCVFGTNNFDMHKLALLKVYGVQSIQLFFDGDVAGQEAAKKVTDMCDEIGMPSSIIPIATGTDPGDLTKERVIDLREYLYGERGPSGESA
jgi:DNA primase